MAEDVLPDSDAATMDLATVATDLAHVETVIGDVDRLDMVLEALRSMRGGLRPGLVGGSLRTGLVAGHLPVIIVCRESIDLNAWDS
jgi:hypothetical protein